MGTLLLRFTVVFVSLLIPAIAQQRNDTDLHFVFLISGRNGEAAVEQNTAGVVPAVDMALQEINSARILPGYRLLYTELLDTTCARNVSLEEFFSDIRSQPPARLFVIGCGCSIATEPVAEISHFWEVVMMSYASMSPMLSNRIRFPNYYRTVPEAVGLGAVLLTTMDYYGWKRLVVVSQEENVFSLVLDNIEQSFSQRSNSSLGVVRFRSDSNIIAKNDLFNQTDDIRVYFLNMFPQHARRVLCASTMPSATVAASAPSFKYPYFIWITLDWYPSKWWTSQVAGDDPAVNCTDEQFEQILNRSLVIAQYPQAENNSSPTDVRMTRAQFDAEYRSRLAVSNDSFDTFAAPFAYDTLWSMAFALNRSNINISFPGFSREQQHNLTLEIIRQLEGLDFIGVTGPVSFKDGNRVQTQPRVLQYRFDFPDADNIQAEIGTIKFPGMLSSSNTSNITAPLFVYRSGENNITTWPLFGVPLDGSPIIRLEAILLPVFIVFSILATCGLCIVVFFTGFNLIFRKRKVIRLTSPNLNYIILFGCALLYISMYFYVVPVYSDDVRHATCIIRAFTQPLGSVLLFGTLCCKMGRVYFIFRNLSPKKKKRTIHDWQLMLIMLAVVALVVVLVIIWVVSDNYGPMRVPDNERPSTKDENSNVTVMFENLVCDSPRATFWIVALFVVILVTQILAVFFAFATRKVRIKTLNDTKEVSIIIYITSGIWLILLIGVFVLAQFLNADAAVFSFCLFLFATVSQLILFIPKVVNLAKDPKGENIFERSNSQPSFMSGNHLDTVDRERVSAMTAKIMELEGRLRKYEPVTPFVFRRRFHSASNVLDSTVDRHRTTSSVPLVRTDFQTTSLNASIVASYTPRMVVAKAPPVTADSGVANETPLASVSSEPEPSPRSPEDRSPTGKGSCDDLLSKDTPEKDEYTEKISNGTKKNLTFSDDV